MARTSGGLTGVASVFGRTGVVVAESGDYTAAEVGALPTTTTYAPGSTVTDFVPDTAGTGAAATLASVALSAGEWLVTGTVTIGTAAATLDVPEVALTSTAASFAGAYKIIEADVGDVAGATEGQVVTLVCSVTLAVAGTVYLVWSAATTTTAKGFTNATGIVAVQTAA